MRTLRTTIALLALAALLSTPAFAQQQKGRGRGGFGGFGGPGGFGGGAMLLANEGVQKELNLDDAQKEKVTKLNEANRAKFAENRSALEGLEGEALTKKRQEIQKTQGEETRKALADILKPEQSKRLHQITLQQQGVIALASNEEAQKDLKVTDDQKTKLQTIARENGEKMRELRPQGGGGGNFQEIREKMTALRTETTEKVNAVLTDDQKKAWKELIGAPFEVQFRRPNNNN